MNPELIKVVSLPNIRFFYKETVGPPVELDGVLLELDLLVGESVEFSRANNYYCCYFFGDPRHETFSYLDSWVGYEVVGYQLSGDEDQEYQLVDLDSTRAFSLVLDFEQSMPGWSEIVAGYEQVKNFLEQNDKKVASTWRIQVEETLDEQGMLKLTGQIQLFEL